MYKSNFYWFFTKIFILTFLLGGCSTTDKSRPLAPYENFGTKNSSFQTDRIPPKQVALLLPLEGSHKEISKSIQEGFLAAHYKNLHHQGAALTIKIYNTGRGDAKHTLKEAYIKAINENADFIIGPLTKPEVELVAHLRKDIPTLALNTIRFVPSLNSFYQFGLSPEDEAMEAALKALGEGKRQALVIIPKGSLGERSLTAFKTQFELNGGVVRDVAQVEASPAMKEKIKLLLKATDLPADNTTSILPPNVIRTDIDCIFMPLSNELARQVKPFINYYFADHLPIYATSTIYQKMLQSPRDRDLDGIQFCDTPFSLPDTELEGIKNALQVDWGKHFVQNEKLFAFGHDIYKLVTDQYPIENLRLRPFYGYTGILSLDNDNRIRRKLIWAKIQEGVPIRLGPSTYTNHSFPYHGRLD
ncbi:MAG: lipoprotein [Francisellaceae bacterium]|nr:lipoprotein [Francisellaceae bacterium]